MKKSGTEGRSGRIGLSIPGALSRTFLAVACVTVSFAGFSITVALAQNEAIKISAGQSFSNVFNFKVSPDGEYTVYTHDAETDNAFDLWSVPTRGGLAPVRLSAALPASEQITFFEITPDSSRVVFLEPQSQGQVDLLSVPITGGPPIQLDDALRPGASIGGFRVSPDGNHVVFLANQDITELELFSVPTAGGTAVRISGPLLDPSIDLSDFYSFSPDSSLVVYEIVDQNSMAFRHFSVPIGGGPIVTLNPPPPTGGAWREGHEISPDGNWVLFRLERSADEFDLYSVPIGGGDTILLNNAADTVFESRIAGDSTRVVYQGRRGLSSVIMEIFSVPIDGGFAVKLTPSIADGGNTRDFIVTPDSSRVVYSANQDSVEKIELYSVPIAGGSPNKLNHTLLTDDDDVNGPLLVSNDSQWVVYRGFISSFGINQYYGYRAQIAGPAGNGEIIWSNVVNRQYEISPDQQSVVLIGEGRSGIGPPDGVNRLWMTKLTGTPTSTAQELVPINFLVPGGQVSRFIASARGDIVYTADQDVNNRIELYSLGPGIFRDGFETSN